MKAAFRKDNGEYVDNEESAQRLGLGYNPANLERYGLTEDGIVVVEKAGKKPWLKKFVGGKLVDDKEKIKAIKDREKAEKDKVKKREKVKKSALKKLAALGLTEEEVAVLVGEGEE